MYRVLAFMLCSSISVHAKDPYKRNASIDIQKYVFQLEVNDSTDVIDGTATVTVLFKNAVNEFELDLVNKNNAGMGMEVSEVSLNGSSISFEHKNDRLKIKLPTTVQHGELNFEIKYRGIPQDGLIIGKNKFGDRGFFGDNWPDLGHHWLPVIDHPSDKAKVDFIVTAPHYYSVVANGIRLEESFVDKKRKLSHWHEEVPIPVKVMVIGVARFAVQYVGKVNDIQIETWVYPQNKKDGFNDFAIGLNVLKFFHNHVGPYPFKKLANVQSKTRHGGLENASAIFYNQSVVDGKGGHDGLIAHEIAHQWFGDSACEDDWHHVWLSEGFATYFSNLYLAYAYGRERLMTMQKQNRTEVIEYYKKSHAPIVDTTITEIKNVLSTNTYQKAGWVLHMLRHKLGDTIFWKGIHQYYETYQNSNVLTKDFVNVMERASGQKLQDYFQQWLYRGGHPRLQGKWRYDATKKEVAIELNQVQKETAFAFPIDIEMEDINGNKIVHTLDVKNQYSKFKLPQAQEIKSIGLDPNVWLLFEGEISKR